MMNVARDPAAARLAVFLRFVGLSGLGWLLDISILLFLVGVAAVPPFLANVISSCTAALSVFLISRRFIFHRHGGALPMRVLVYLAYTLCVIFVAAMALQAIATLLGAEAASRGILVSAAMLAGVAKIIVTPPQLVLNFIVARLVSERALGRTA